MTLAEITALAATMWPLFMFCSLGILDPWRHLL